MSGIEEFTGLTVFEAKSGGSVSTIICTAASSIRIRLMVILFGAHLSYSIVPYLGIGHLNMIV